MTILDPIEIWDRSSLSSADTVLLASFAESLERSVGNVQLLFGGANTGMTYNSNNNKISWTKMYGALAFTLYIQLSAKGTSTGVATITGFPYNPDLTNKLTPTFCGTWNNVATTNSVPIMGNLTTGPVCTLNKASSGGQVNATDADFLDTSIIRLTGIYRIAS